MYGVDSPKPWRREENLCRCRTEWKSPDVRPIWEFVADRKTLRSLRTRSDRSPSRAFQHIFRVRLLSCPQGTRQHLTMNGCVRSEMKRMSSHKRPITEPQRRDMPDPPAA